MSNTNKPVVNIKKTAYAMEMSGDGAEATLTLYGDVVETRPVDWWTGEAIKGDFICQDEFLEDLKAIEGAKAVTVRVNSVGGDAAVGLLIHNRLRELSRNGARLTGLVDGVAMSAGSVILSACDTVKVNPTSLIMIHRAASLLWGFYNKDELEQEADALGKWDAAMIAAYKRKCGLSETVISHMMSDITYLTGAEAVEKGFADEIIEDAEPTQIAASADGRRLFVNGRAMHLAPGTFAPDNIPTVTPEASAAVETNTLPDDPGKIQEGGNSMTLEEFRAQNPEAAAQLEAEAKTAAQNDTADAVKAERKRLEEIDAVAGVIDPALVKEAKYGEKACSAQELTYRAALANAKAGRTFVSDLEADNLASGAQNVSAAHDPGEETPREGQAPEARLNEARSQVKALFGKEGK